jgi:hypothetical protein
MLIIHPELYENNRQSENTQVMEIKEEKITYKTCFRDSNNKVIQCLHLRKIILHI